MSDFLSAAQPRRPSVIARNADAGLMLLRRWGACWIDLMVVTLLLVGAFLAAGLSGLFEERGNDTHDAVLGLGILLVTPAIALGYYLVTEMRWGQTLGKKIVGLIVVDDNGRPPGFGRSLVRTLFRLIEVNPFLLGGVPAGIAVLVTPKRQRLGDLVAGTYVVLKKDITVFNDPEQQAIVFD